MTKLQRTMGSVLARDDLTAHSSGARFYNSGGTGFDSRLRSGAFPLDQRAPTVLEAIRLPGLIHVAFEDHSGEVAVAFRIPGVVARKIGEVLHVDLYGGCADTMAVILVEPGAGGFVAVVTDDDVGICPGRTASLAHVTQPAALGAVRPYLRNICDAEGVCAGVDLDIGRLLTWKFGLIDGDVLKSSGLDNSVPLSMANERLVLVVDVNSLDGSLSISQAVTVETDPDSKRGIICWILRRKEPFDEREDANNTSYNANDICHCEGRFRFSHKYGLMLDFVCAEAIVNVNNGV